MRKNKKIIRSNDKTVLGGNKIVNLSAVLFFLKW